MSEHVHVIATFAVRADAVEDFIAAAQRLLVEPTQAEPGCIRYELCRAEGEAGQLAMIETWETAAALERHLAQPSLSAALDELRPMVTAMPVVRRYGPA